MMWKVIITALLEFWAGIVLCVNVINNPLIGLMAVNIGSTIGFLIPVSIEMLINYGGNVFLNKTNFGKKINSRK